MRITSVAGGPDDAAAGTAGRVPGGRRRGSTPRHSRPAKSEQALLTRLSAAEPCESRSGGWELFEIRQAVPLAVATLPADPDGEEDREKGTELICATTNAARRCPPPGRSGKLAPSPFPDGGHNLADGRRRVVTWGLAMPTAEAEWSVYTFQPDRAGEPGPPRPGDVPLPPGARRTLAVETPGNGGAGGLRGGCRTRDWKPFFEDWFAQCDYRPVAAWQRGSDSWHLRCRRNRAARRHRRSTCTWPEAIRAGRPGW